MSKSGIERRKYLRETLSCPTTLKDLDGNVLHRTSAENVSDGGLFLAMPVSVLPKLGGELHVCLSVPRATANTYMLEDFTCKARIVRHQPMVDHTQAGMALEFAQPQSLMLRV